MSCRRGLALGLHIPQREVGARHSVGTRPRVAYLGWLPGYPPRSAARVFLGPIAFPPPRQFQNAVPELFTDLYVFRALVGTPVHLKWRGDLSRLKKTCFGHIA
jgi:hypothetical protein